jgi:penicillin-binding protein activator
VTVRTILILCGLCVLVTSCGREVEIADPNLDLNLSGNWNAADSREVAAIIIPLCINAAWIDDFQKRNGRTPVVRMGHVRVRVEDLDDEIDPEIFIDDLTRALIDSGRVRVVASRAEAQSREGTRATRDEMATHADTKPAQAAELASDYLLTGGILSQNDEILDKGVVSGTYRRVKYYHVTLTLIDLTTNERIWSEACERKKLIEQSTTSFGLGQ